MDADLTILSEEVHDLRAELAKANRGWTHCAKERDDLRKWIASVASCFPTVDGGDMATVSRSIFNMCEERDALRAELEASRDRQAATDAG